MGSIVAFGNSGPDAVIGKVNLTRPHHIELLHAYAVLITGHELYADSQGLPLQARQAAGVQWSHRQLANGARIPHLRDHDVIDIVLEMKLLGKSGTAAGVDVYYQSSGQQYVLHENTDLLLTRDKTCPNGKP